MTREIQDIPPAPRRVRGSAVFWHRWPLLLTALALTVYGGAWTLMLELAGSGKLYDDDLLDATAHTTTARIERVEPASGREQQDRVTYRFEAGDRLLADQRCFTPPGTHRAGEEARVQYLPGRPHLNRLQGGRLCLLPSWLRPQPYFWALVFPGLLLLVWWSRGQIGLWRMLATGDVAVARIEGVRPVPVVLPAMLRVDYRYRDHRAREHHGHHWVGSRTTLGTRLLEGAPRLPLIHHRRRPSFSRLCLPADCRTPADSADTSSHPTPTGR